MHTLAGVSARADWFGRVHDGGELMFRNHLSSHCRIAQPSTGPAADPVKTLGPAMDDPPEIAALERAILQSQEDNWAHYNVPDEERARLRQGIVAHAKTVCDALRPEHAT